MKIESKEVIVNQTAVDTCAYLSDVKNYEQLMPENTSKFEVLSNSSFVFALQGMPEIELEIKEVNSPNHVILGSTNDKFPFTLTGNVIDNSDSNSAVQLLFEGKFNTMMAMMIKGPITKFINTLATNLEKI